MVLNGQHAWPQRRDLGQCTSRRASLALLGSRLSACPYVKKIFLFLISDEQVFQLLFPIDPKVPGQFWSIQILLK